MTQIVPDQQPVKTAPLQGDEGAAAPREKGAPTRRENGIDALRGVAILAMVASHLSREVLESPHPLWLRVFGSLAAPLFITLAGLLVARTIAIKQHPLGYYCLRAGLILLLAAVIDLLLWGLYPLIGCDVLYLIGIAMPLTALFVRLRPAAQVALMALWLALTIGLQATWGYPKELTLVALYDSPARLAQVAPQIVQQWFVSGWFPLFPWLLFSFLGARIFQFSQKRPASANRPLAATGLTLAAIGLLAGWLLGTPFYERGGYSELFYPPGLDFVMTASGVVLMVLPMARLRWLASSRPLVELGRCSLFVYVAHLVFLSWGIGHWYENLAIPQFLLLYAALVAMLIGLAGLVEAYKRRSTRRLPLMLRLLLGS